MLATHQTPINRNGIPHRQQMLVIEPIGDAAKSAPTVLLPGKFLIGSATDCALILHGDGVSSRHCLIITDRDQSFVWTLDADTWLNAGRVREAVLSVGDQLTVGSVHLRIREATMQERLDGSPNGTPNSAVGHVSADRSAVSTSDANINRPSVDRLSVELERQLAKLRNDVTSQQQKLTEALERQNASVDRVAEQQREVNLSDQRIETANRKEALLRELLSSVQERSEELNERHRVLSAEQARCLDEISRRRNDATIESALIRANRNRLELHQRELDGQFANLHEQTHEWEESKRRTEQVHSQRDRNASELQIELDHRQTEIDLRDEQLRQLQEDCREQRARIDQRAEQLSDEQSRFAEEHTARKQALSSRLTGMAQWESTIATRQDELNALAESLKAGEEQSRLQTDDWRRRLDSVADTAERQQSLETTLNERAQTLEEQQRRLEARAEQLEQHAESQQKQNRALDERATQHAANVHENQETHARLHEQANQLGHQAELLDQRQAAAAELDSRLANCRDELDNRDQQLMAERQEWECELRQEQDGIESARADLAAAKETQHDEFARRDNGLDRRETELSILQNQLTADRIALDAAVEELSAEKRLLTDDRLQLEQSRIALAEAERETELEMALVHNEQEDLRQQQQELAATQQQCAEEQREFDSQQDELAGKQRELDGAREEHDRREFALNEEHRAIDELRRSLEADRELLEQDRGECDSRRQQLETTREELAAERQQTDQRRAEQEGDRHELDAERQLLVDRQRTLETDAEQLSAREQQVEADTSELTMERDRLEADYESLAALQGEIRAEREALDGQQAELETQNKTLEQQQAALQQEREAFEAAQSELQTGQNTLTADRESLQAERESYDAVRAEWEGQRTQFESDRESLTATREAFEVEQQQLAADRETLQTTRKEFDAERTDAETAQADFQCEQEALATAQSELEIAHGTLTADRETLQAERETYDASRSELEKQRKTLEAARKEFDVERGDTEALLADAETQRDAVAIEQAELAVQRDSLDSMQTELETERRMLDQREQDIQQRRSAYDDEAARLETERQELRKAAERLAAREDELELRQRHCNDEQSAFEAHTGESAAASESVEIDKAAVERDRDQLQVERTEFEAERDAVRRESDERVQQLDDELQSERTQAAALQEKISADLVEMTEKHADSIRKLDQLRESQINSDPPAMDETSGLEQQLEAQQAYLDAELVRLESERQKLATQRQKAAAEAQELTRGQAAVEEERMILDEERVRLADERSELERRRNERQPEGNLLDSELPTEFQSRPELTPDTHRPRETPGEELYDHFLSRQQSSDAGYADDSFQDQTDVDLTGQIDQPDNSPTNDDGDLLSMFDQYADEIGSDATDDLIAHGHPFSPGTAPLSDSLFGDATDDFGLGDAQDEEASELRETLADMFGLDNDESQSPQDADGRSEASAADLQSPAPRPQTDEECDGLLTSMMDVLGGDSPSGSRLDSTLQSDSPTIDAAANSNASSDTADTGASAASNAEGESADGDCISTYMEQLLARSRKNSGATAQTAIQSATQSTDLTEQPSTVSLRASAGVEENAPVTPVQKVSLAELAPAHVQDKDATRADMQSLRELANLSARTAIATHATKEMRGKLLVSSLLTVVAFTVAAVLLTGKLWGSMSYQATGWASALVGAIMAAELIRSTLLVHRVKSTGQIANLNRPTLNQPLAESTRSNRQSLPGRPQRNAEPIEIDAFVIDDDEADAEIIDDVVVG